jgi:hypothetical protein
MSLPNDFEEWAINDPLKVEAPLQVFANEGYNNTDKPSYKHFNFFINRLSQLYNAILTGLFDTKGITPYTSDLEYENIMLKGRVSYLEETVENLDTRLKKVERGY